MSTFNEQRHFTRIPFDAEVTLTSRTDTDNQSYHASLLDICLKGVLITRPTGWNADTGSSFELSLNLSGQEIEDETHLAMEVNLAHLDEKHIGFEITQMDLDTATHLHRLVELNLGSETLLKRELSELISTHTSS